MSLPSRLLGANPSIQVSSLLSGSLTTPSAKGAFVPETAYQSIQSVLVASATSTISFTSIPQTFTHLEIRGHHWLEASGNNWDSGTLISFNNDTTDTNYYNHGFYSFNNTAPTYFAGNYRRFGLISGGNENGTYYPAQTLGVITEYSNSSKYKIVRIRNGVDNTGTGGYSSFQTELWKNTNAITQIDITPSGGNWAPGTRFSLYGIKGA